MDIRTLCCRGASFTGYNQTISAAQQSDNQRSATIHTISAAQQSLQSAQRNNHYNQRSATIITINAAQQSLQSTQQHNHYNHKQTIPMKLFYYKFCFYLLLLVSGSNLFAQNNKGDTEKPDLSDYVLSIQKSEEVIKVDGKLEEKAWAIATKADNFYQNKPNDSTLARTKTAVQVTYDDRYLYIGAVCYDDLEGDYVVQSLKRDFDYYSNDNFEVYLDPFRNQQFGFAFGVSAVGVQREALIQNGGNLDLNWDNKWFSAVSNYADRWVVEMAIPFKTLRFKEDLTEWGINFARNDQKQVETSTWTPIPTQQQPSSLALAATLEWDNAPQQTGKNIAIIPYATARVDKDFNVGVLAVQPQAEWGGAKVGADAKVAITSSLNLDLTVNPDFSQVEVDRQVLNLDRFNIFFPERRNFFLENADLFNYGQGALRPFFSRRIGLNAAGQPTPIQFGARLTGNLTEDWRVGVMSMQTKAQLDAANPLQSQNYSVATLQRKVLDRSNVTGFLVNRQSFDDFAADKDDYNRVGGMEFNYNSKDNTFQSGVRYHHSFTQRDDVTGSNPFNDGAFLANYGYTGRSLFSFFNFAMVNENFTADVGFVQNLYHRNDETATWQAVPYVSTFFDAGYAIYTDKSDKLRFWGPEYFTDLKWERDGMERYDHYQLYKIFIYFNDNSIARIASNRFYSRLLFPTNITGSMPKPLPAESFTFQDFGVEYQSPLRKKLNGILKAYYGDFYNGERFRMNGELNYRIQPWGRFGITYNYNQIQFPEEYGGKSQLLLLGPRVELTFSKSVFLTTFVQYNNQWNNINVNSRLQWRFAPMSDFFLVLTDNMYAEEATDGWQVYQPFEQKNWGLVAKLSYWLGI